MKKADRFFSIVYCLLLAIQVVFCVLWIAKSSLRLPLIYESSIYLDAAKAMKFDEYSGVLYPLFLRFFYLKIGAFSDVAGRVAVAAVQLIAISLSILFFVCHTGKFGLGNYIRTLVFVISFPVVIYIVFLMTPEAFALSFFLVWCGYLLKKEKKTIDIFLMVTAYIMAGILSIKYAYIIGAIWIVYIVTLNHKKLFLNLARLLSGICFIIVIDLFLITPGCYGRMPASLGTGLVSNFSYEVLVHDHYFWPEEAKEVIPFENLGNILMDRSHVVTKMGEPLLKNYSYWKTDLLGLQIAKASMMVRSRETIDRFLGNLTGYLLTPVTFLENISGQGKSASAINIYSMAGGNSRLAVLYMVVGIMICSINALIAGVRWLFAKEKLSDGSNAFVFWFMTYIVVSVFWALFAFNYFDYMLMSPVILLGLIIMAGRREICK